MPFRNWLSHPPIGVGLGIVALLIIASLAQKPHQADCRDGGPNQYQACTFGNVSKTSVSPDYGIHTPKQNPKPERNEWREESDLYAQWNMAWWARVSAIIAGIGLAITGVGIVLVKQTLDTNRAAVEVANRAIENEREIGEAQVRAYITPTDTDLTFEGDVAELSFRLTNGGNSAAFKLQAFCGFGYNPGIQPHTAAIDQSTGSGVLLGTLSHGMATTRATIRNRHRIPVDDRIMATFTVTVELYAMYFDVFSKKHIDKFIYTAFVDRPNNSLRVRLVEFDDTLVRPSTFGARK